jgi:class 3 adenylate cyclase
VANSDDIRAEVRTIFRSTWTERDGTAVPESEDVKLANDAVNLQGTVLYADLAESTAMVNHSTKHFAAEIYKTFLISACRIITYRGGTITAFDGDRIMAVFLGDRKNTDAARTALHINWAVLKVVNDEIKALYRDTDYVVRHCVGVDTSGLFIARTGIRGSNDLVWVGRAANYAAKLCTLRDGAYASWITKPVYDVMMDEAKFGPKGEDIWEARTWTPHGITVYRSNWFWSV